MARSEYSPPVQSALKGSNGMGQRLPSIQPLLPGDSHQQKQGSAHHSTGFNSTTLPLQLPHPHAYLPAGPIYYDPLAAQINPSASNGAYGPSMYPASEDGLRHRNSSRDYSAYSTPTSSVHSSSPSSASSALYLPNPLLPSSAGPSNKPWSRSEYVEPLLDQSSIPHRQSLPSYQASMLPLVNTSYSNASSAFPAIPHNLTHTPPPSAQDGTNQTALNHTPSRPSRIKGTRHLACKFCRGRKLKCIFDEPEERCRQCLRRGHIQCLPASAAGEEDRQTAPPPKKRKRPVQSGQSPSSPKSQTGSKFAPGCNSGQEISPVVEGFPSNSHIVIGNGTHGPEPSPQRSASFDQIVLPLDDCAYPSIVDHPRSAIKHRSVDSDEADTYLGYEFADLSPSQAITNTNQVFVTEGTPNEGADKKALTAQSQHPLGTASSHSIATVENQSSQPYEMHTNWPFANPGQSTAGPGPSVMAWGSDWWDRCLATFGPRPRSLRIVESLILQFVAKHASLMSVFHGQSFIEEMRRPEKRSRLHPAVVFSALAAAVCDIKVPRREEPFAADIAAADANAQRLAYILRRMAKEYIDNSLISGQSVNVGLAQAASTLALTETAPEEHHRLLSIVESVIRNLESHMPISAYKASDRPELPEPSHSDYYARPTCQASRESEIMVEAMVRISKTQISHRVRQALARPDEDITTAEIPEFVSRLRAFQTWEPSSLPDILPESYFRSAQLARLASVLSKAFVRVIRLEATSPSEDSNLIYRPDVALIWKDLSTLEPAFCRLRRQKNQESADIFPEQAQNLLVKIYLYIRVCLWRKTRTWVVVEGEAGTLSVTILWWLALFAQSIKDLQLDADSCFTSKSFVLTSSTAQIESALHHVRFTIQLLEALSYPHPEIEKLLRDGLNTLRVQVDLRPGCVTPTGIPLLNILDEIEGAFNIFLQGRNQLLLITDRS